MTYVSPEILSEEAKKIVVDYITRIDDLKPKERTKIPSQEMPTQAPEIRIHNLDEVALGYSMEQAKVEAMRCLQCVKKNCVEDCRSYVAHTSPICINQPSVPYLRCQQKSFFN